MHSTRTTRKTFALLTQVAFLRTMSIFLPINRSIHLPFNLVALMHAARQAALPQVKPFLCSQNMHLIGVRSPGDSIR